MRFIHTEYAGRKNREGLRGEPQEIGCDMHMAEPSLAWYIALGESQKTIGTMHGVVDDAEKKQGPKGE